MRYRWIISRDWGGGEERERGDGLRVILEAFVFGNVWEVDRGKLRFDLCKIESLADQYNGYMI